MAYLIVSDIHANLEALNAVLASAEGRYDRILCLGDLVGYGADPNAISEWARAHAHTVIRGNHDKVCTSGTSLGDYNPSARKSAEWTQKALTRENVAYLQGLPSGPVSCRFPESGEPTLTFDLVHGSPVDEDEYLVTAEDVWLRRSALTAPITFFGHTHLQGGFLLARGGVRQIRGQRTLTVNPDHFMLVNPGSVGQPRDGDPRAAFILFTPEDGTIEYQRVEYDIDGAAAKIRAVGLPDSLASRLYEGK